MTRRIKIWVIASVVLLLYLVAAFVGLLIGAPVLRLQSLLFRQFLEQIFISHCHSHRSSEYIDGITPLQPLQMLNIHRL